MLGLKAWTTLEVTMASTDPMPTVGLCGLLDSLTCGGILCSHEALFLKLGLFNFFGNDIDVGWSEDELAELRAEIVNLGGSRSVTDEWVLSACRQEARGRLEANVRSVFAWRDDESIVRLVRGAMTVFGWREVGFGRFFRKSIDERNFESLASILVRLDDLWTLCPSSVGSRRPRGHHRYRGSTVAGKL